MIESFSLLSALLVGLLGGVHCVGMCGGIVGALSFQPHPDQSPRQSFWPLLLAYNLGRILSYTLAGMMMGGLGVMLAGWLPVAIAQKMLLMIAGIFMLLLGFYLAGWWGAVILGIERGGSFVWKRLEPLGRKLLPVKHVRQAVLLGLLWGWLPCGLVYSVLIWSVSAGSVQQGGLLMLAFGLGTLPNLLAMGVIARRFADFMHKSVMRKIAGLLVMVLGVYNIYLSLINF